MNDNFLENIIDEVGADLDQRDSDKAESDAPDPNTSTGASVPSEKVVSRENKTVKKVSRSASKPQAPNPRVYAKARIQKSIRFRPELIARLDTYLESRESNGKEPISLQSAQNEALELWLTSKKF